MASISVPSPVSSDRDLRARMLDACERVAGAFLLLLALPVILSSALVVRVLSGRSPWIAHRRMGWQGADLWMLKLRTMWGTEPGGTAGWVEYIDDAEGPARKRAGDPRVANRFARFCRRHSIDELPQLWHVVAGEMSLIGPRPMTLTELRRYYGEDAAEILRVKPGLAGLWQVSGRNRLTYEERRRLDLKFVREAGPGMYLTILLRTLPEVLGGENTW
ncbi:MAG: sugar transferase [Acidobacteria bacterium]|nr:sugar transferase [Acidobacteriota bacterium]